MQANIARSSSYNSSCESDDGDRFDALHLTEGTTSAAEWIGITTNSEECSVTSEVEESEGPNGSKILDDHPFAWEFQLVRKFGWNRSNLQASNLVYITRFLIFGGNRLIDHG